MPVGGVLPHPPAGGDFTRPPGAPVCQQSQGCSYPEQWGRWLLGTDLLRGSTGISSASCEGNEIEEDFSGPCPVIASEGGSSPLANDYRLFTVWAHRGTGKRAANWSQSPPKTTNLLPLVPAGASTALSRCKAPQFPWGFISPPLPKRNPSGNIRPLA